MTEPEAVDATPPRPTVSDLEIAILGEAPSMRGSEIAAASGVTEEQARRLWRALGFPDAANQPAFTAADVDALKLVNDTVRDSGIDFDTMLRLTRAIGHTVARLADWQMATLSTAMEEFSGPDLSSQRAM